jgi:transposase InsO family protein
MRYLRFEKEPLFKKTSTNKILKETFYNPETGLTGVNELQRRTDLPKESVEEFLKHQETYTKHKPLKHKFVRRRTFSPDIDHQFQADLVDMRSYSRFNGGYTYILTCIDVFSKFAFALPLKHKTGQQVAAALNSIFQQRAPALLSVDKGLEFKNPPVKAVLDKYSVNMFSTESELKASIVERFNRTLKDRMFRYFTANNTKRWIEVLPDLIKNYNSSQHRSIRMTPVQASLSENSDIVYQRLYPEDTKKYKAKYKVGDMVRIYMKEGDFKRGFTPNYTQEVFKVEKIEPTKPVTYVLKDSSNDNIIGKFYAQELSHVLSSHI